MVCLARRLQRKFEVEIMLKSATTRKNLTTLGVVILVYIIVMICASLSMLPLALSRQLPVIFSYIVMGLSLNLVVGFLGELSLGHAGFMGIGAFSGAVAAATLASHISSPTLLMIVCLLIGGLIAGFFGAIIGIPVLRLRGDYLAIVTLAFCEIIRNILNCLYIELDEAGLHFSLFAENVNTFSGNYIVAGAKGASIANKISSPGIGFALVLFSLIIIMNIVHSKEGRAIKAIRDNAIAADSIGLNITAYKMKAFVISAVLAGMAGVLFALSYSTVEAKQFDFNKSISILVMVVLGGMGSIQGTLIAVTALRVLEVFLLSFSEYWMLIYALVLILVMILNANARFIQFKLALIEKIQGTIHKKEAKVK